MATDRLSIIFATLADPTRRAILARLSEGDATVSELAEPFSISLPAISRHLKVLAHAGLISRSRSAQWRSSSLQAEPLQEATAWMERYREFWDSNFDRLDAHLRQIQQDQAETQKELVITRVFDAPRELVYKAFTDPDQIAQWFGPEGYSVPRDTVDIDLRVGGHQRFTMVPDSEEFPPGGPVDAVYDEIVEPELLVGHEEFDEAQAKLFGSPRMTLRIEFHDENGKTRLVLRQGPYSKEFEDMARQGWNSSFGKLDKLLVS